MINGKSDTYELLRKYSPVRYNGRMLKTDAAAHYGTVKALCDALGIRRSTYYDWDEYVPEQYAVWLTTMTRGALKLDCDAYTKRAGRPISVA